MFLMRSLQYIIIIIYWYIFFTTINQTDIKYSQEDYKKDILNIKNISWTPVHLNNIPSDICDPVQRIYVLFH